MLTDSSKIKTTITIDRTSLKTSLVGGTTARSSVLATVLFSATGIAKLSFKKPLNRSRLVLFDAWTGANVTF